MKAIFALIAIVLIAALTLTGCAATTDTTTTPAATSQIPTTPPTQQAAATTSAAPTTTAATEGITITDDIGRMVKFTSSPQRIISLSPSNTEVVYALGLQDRLIGVTTYDNYPPEAKDKPQVSGYSEVDVEKIVALQPDLILADDIHKAEVVPALEKLGMKVVVLRPGTIQQVFDNLNLLGKITGTGDKAASLVATLQQRVKAVTDKIAAGTTKPRVLYVTWYDPIWTAGDDTMIGDLLAKAGATNIASDVSGYATITLEEAIQRNPQIIIVMSSMGVDNESLKYVNSEPRFAATDAVKNKQTFEIDADIFGRTTPRIVDGLETLAKLIHPELFK